MFIGNNHQTKFVRSIIETTPLALAQFLDSLRQGGRQPVHDSHHQLVPRSHPSSTSAIVTGYAIVVSVRWIERFCGRWVC
jgi:hypothetical protein